MVRERRIFFSQHETKNEEMLLLVFIFYWLSKIFSTIFRFLFCSSMFSFKIEKFLISHLKNLKVYFIMVRNNNRNFGTLAFYHFSISNVILLLFKSRSFTEVEASNWKWGQEVVQELEGVQRAHEKLLLLLANLPKKLGLTHSYPCETELIE